MPTTRSGHSANSSPTSSQNKSSGGAGTKRKANGSPGKAKRGKKGEQKTLEETLHAGSDAKDIEMKDQVAEDKTVERPEFAAEKPQEQIKDESKTKTNGQADGEKVSAIEEEEMIAAGEEAEKEQEQEQERAQDDTKDGPGNTVQRTSNGDDEAKTSAKDDKPHSNGDTGTQTKERQEANDAAEPKDSAVLVDASREQAEPSNILEKGLIYFFFRGRVGLDDPQSIDEIQRSYIILRPLPLGGKLDASGKPVGDAGKNRIIAIPKKVLPLSRRDTFLCFVEQASASFDEIRDSHLKQSDYATKTRGTRHTPAAKPIAEGVYAITTTGRESHLSYILTVPQELGEVQRDIGLSSRGAFITSVRNPTTSAPPGTALPNQPEYSEEIMKDFRGLRWSRLEPAHLDYVNTQFLLIGEGESDKLEKSVQADKGDGQEEGKMEPKEEMELLEEEDRKRINALKGDDSEAIFKDLGMSQEEYSKIQTSWE